eukprot:GHVR01169871.1.p1 GENE.GHVR01169871.1~~GHVR01169871.1.p1  ORF type:complete len:135 (+),score=12.33 GHVR01169871.1:112-516(+)
MPLLCISNAATGSMSAFRKISFCAAIVAACRFGLFSMSSTVWVSKTVSPLWCDLWGWSPIGAGFEHSPLKGVVSKTCYVANAVRGETGQIDKSGAARSAPREDTVLSICLVRGGRLRLPPDGKGAFGSSKSRLT